MKLFVCTHHTGGEYAILAARLVASAAAFGVKVEAREYPDTGNWYANAAYKTAMLSNLVFEGRLPILYLDADCVVKGPLDGLGKFLTKADLVVRFRDNKRDPYNSGVLLLGTGSRVQAMVRQWHHLATAYSHRYDTADQRLLPAAVRSCGAFRVVNLPARFNHQPNDVGEGVIVHGKASKAADRVTREWKKCRLLEEMLVRRTEDCLKAPSNHPVRLAGAAGPSSSPAAVGYAGEAEAVNPTAVADFGVPTAVWTNNLKTLGDCVRRAVVVIAPTRCPEGDVGSYLRHGLRDVAKFSTVSPPDSVLLYYPQVPDEPPLETAELPADPWDACLTALAKRGGNRQFRLDKAMTPDEVARVRITAQVLGLEEIK